MLLNQGASPIAFVPLRALSSNGLDKSIQSSKLPKRKPISRFIGRVPPVRKHPFVHSDTNSISTNAASDVVDTTSFTDEQSKDSEEKFNWFKTWWPLYFVRDLEDDRPNRLQLMGRWYVAWKGLSGEWNVMDDMCPHRLAPLSEGRIEDDGTLLCAYHAWRFDETGKCVKIPQADSKAAECTACNSRRSAVTKYPSKVVGGVLWVWPDASEESTIESELSPIPMRKDLVDRCDKLEAMGTPLGYTRILPYGFDILIENLADPAHLPVSHHKVFPFFDRYDIDSLQMRTTDPISGPHLKEEVLASFNVLINRVPSTMSIIAPNHIVQEQDTIKSYTSMYSVPLEPGKSRVFFFQISTDEKNADKPPPLPLKLFPWLPHTFTHDVFDGDGVFLNAQDQNLRIAAADRGSDMNGGSKGGWRNYFMATSSDGAISAFRKWIDSKGQGGPPFPSGQSIKMGDFPREELLSRYEQHTKGCKACQQGLNLADRVVTVTHAVMLGCFGGLCAMVGSFGVESLISKLGPGLGSSGFLLGIVAAFLVRRVALDIRQKFLFVDWVHADRD